MTKADKDGQLSVAQLNAIDLLVTGKTDGEVAEAVGVSRQTVNTWRNHDAVFLAALNRERAVIWQAGRDGMASLVGRAVDVLRTGLDSDDDRVAVLAAVHVLKAVDLYGRFAIGAIDAEEIENERQHQASVRLLNRVIYS